MKKVPSWLKKTLNHSPNVAETKRALRRLGLETICEAATCPNLNECFSRHFATFMILGGVCTRGCGFCGARRRPRNWPEAVEDDEPRRIRDCARLLGLKYVVITSVTRDDLHDGGAVHFARVISELRVLPEKIAVEVLVPDFQGDRAAIRTVVDSGPDVFSHNIETVSRLYKKVRAEADYGRSLRVLKEARAAAPSVATKSAILVGLGEETGEVLSAIEDLRAAGCDMLTIGQYLQPTRDHAPVERFVEPGEFSLYENFARKAGFRVAKCGPFVRSSYFADETYKEMEVSYAEDSPAAVG